MNTLQIHGQQEVEMMWRCCQESIPAIQKLLEINVKEHNAASPPELLNPDVQLHVSWAEGGLDDISGL